MDWWRVDEWRICAVMIFQDYISSCYGYKMEGRLMEVSVRWEASIGKCGRDGMNSYRVSLGRTFLYLYSKKIYLIVER